MIHRCIKFIFLAMLSGVMGLMSTNAQLKPKLILPIGHTSDVISAKYSPDRKYVLTASWDNTAKIWDATSGRELHSLQGHMGWVRSATYSPDGNYVLTASDDKTAKIWNVLSGRVLYSLQGHLGCVRSATYSLDGKYVLTASDDMTAKIWEVSSGKELHSLQGHTGGINTATFSPDGKFVVTASFDSTAKIWDATSGRELHSLQGHRLRVSSATYSPNGKYVLTASDDMTAKIWDASSGRELRSLQGHTSYVTSAIYSPDGKFVLTASDDMTAKIWDVLTGRELHSLKGHTYLVSSASYSPDGKYVLTTSWDNTAKIWDASSGAQLHSLQGHMIFVLSSTYSSDGKYVLTASMDKTAKIWEVSSGKEIHSLQGHTSYVTSAIYSPDGKNVLTAGWDNTAKIWDASSGKELTNLQGHGGLVISAIYSSDGKYFLTASVDKTAKIWDATSGRELHSLQGHTGWLKSATYSPDGKYVLTASEDSTAKIWDATSGRELHSLQGHKSVVSSATYSPDGKYVLTASRDGTAKIWDASSCRELHSLQGHRLWLNSATFSPDGEYVLTASGDGTAKIWDATSGRELHSFQGHTGMVNSASYSPDGKYVLTAASGDGTAKIWDASTGKELHSLQGHRLWVNSATFSPDGEYVLTASWDNKTILWDATTGKQLYTRLQLKNNDWLIYDEDYHFDGSEGAINYLYLTCGLEIIDLAQVKDSLWIPGLAGKIMRGEQLLINDKPAPKLSDLNICDLTPIVEELPKDAKGNLIFQITPRNGGLGETEVYINENLTYKFQPEQLVKSKNKEGKIVYQLNLSKDSITPFLSGNKGAVNPVLVKCKIKGASIYSRGAEVEMVTEKDPELPKLYAVFVGVNDYNNPQKESNDFLYRNLDYAAKDAGDLANMVEHSAHTLFKDSAFIYRLTGKPNIEPTKDNLKKVLAEIGTKAKANDILYIFFAGHGDILKTKEEKNEIRFMLQGAEKRNKNSGGFGVEELTDWCAPKNIKAQKRVFVFDACHSGQFVNETMAYAQGGRGNEEEVRIRQLTSLKDKNGMMILAASSDNESAYEDPSLNQGVLTYHLLEAVKDSKDSTLQINKWFETTLDLVKEYANANNRKQTPETFGNGRFEIGNVNEQVRAAIQIGAPKPRVGVSVFIDLSGKYPSIKKLVNDHFKQPGSRGFVSATSNEKAYYAEGSLVLENGKLKIQYTLFYGETPLADPFVIMEKKALSEQDVATKIVASIEERINAILKKAKR